MAGQTAVKKANAGGSRSAALAMIDEVIELGSITPFEDCEIKLHSGLVCVFVRVEGAGWGCIGSVGTKDTNQSADQLNHLLHFALSALD